MLERLRFWIYYHLLTYSSPHYNIRWFRFGIPLVMKLSRSQNASEASSLRFLHSTGLHLPIPRVFDSFTVDSRAYAIITRIEGDSFLNVSRRLGDKLTDTQVQ